MNSRRDELSNATFPTLGVLRAKGARGEAITRSEVVQGTVNDLCPGLMRLGARNSRFGWVFLIAMEIAVVGCQQVPVTGRSALTLVRHEDVVRESAKTFEQLKRDKGVSRNRSMNERLQRVGERLSHVVFWDVPDADWEFVVLNAPDEINAHSSAGGKIAVTSGLFEVIKTDGQLAWVVAHEMAHLAARHSDERLSQAMVAEGGALAAAAGLLTNGGTAAAANGVQAFQLSAALTTLSFDRKQELEADYMGLIYMARAGFDPEEGDHALENMMDAKGSLPRPAAIFSTHPEYPERALQLIDRMPQAIEAYEQRNKSAAPIVIK